MSQLFLTGRHTRHTNGQHDVMEIRLTDTALVQSVSELTHLVPLRINAGVRVLVIQLGTNGSPLSNLPLQLGMRYTIHPGNPVHEACSQFRSLPHPHFLGHVCNLVR